MLNFLPSLPPFLLQPSRLLSKNNWISFHSKMNSFPSDICIAAQFPWLFFYCLSFINGTNNVWTIQHENNEEETELSTKLKTVTGEATNWNLDNQKSSPVFWWTAPLFTTCVHPFSLPLSHTWHRKTLSTIRIYNEHKKKTKKSERGEIKKLFYGTPLTFFY